MLSDQREYFASFKFQPFVSNWITVNGGLFFLPPPSRPRNRNRKLRLFGLGGGVYDRRSVGGALQGDRTVDSALTLNCVERNDRGMPVMRSPSNEVAS